MSVSELGSRLRHRSVFGSIVLIAAVVIVVPSQPADALDSALVFDGIDDVATIPNTNNWPILTSSLTVEAWLRPSDLSVHEIIAIIWGEGDYALQQSYSDPSKLIWTISRSATHSASSPTGTLAEGRWDHFAGTYDGTTMRLYRNGNLIAEEDHTLPGDVAVRGEIVLGLRPNAPTYAGSIDELRVWLEVRTQEQIKLWSSRPLTGTEPNLIGYWSFREGVGQVFSDSSPIANGGVLGNTVAVEPEDPQWAAEGVPYLAFFFDGFESGNTTGWSVTIP